MRKPLILLWLLTILGYLPSIGGTFLIDDVRMAESRFVIRTGGDLWLSLRTGFDFEPSPGKTPSEEALFRTYRPIPVTSLLLLKSWFGANALPFHLFNLLLHLAAVTLAFFLAGEFLRSSWNSFFAAAFFALHSYNADAVAWINGLSDPLAFIFMAAAILVVVRRAATIPSLAGTMLLSALAMLCKETAFVVVGFLPLFASWRAADRHRAAGPALAGAMALVLVWQLRFLSLGSSEVHAAKFFSRSFLLDFPLFVAEAPVHLLSLFTSHVVMLKEEWVLRGMVPPAGKLMWAGVFYAGAAWLYFRTFWKRSASPFVIFLIMFICSLAPVFYVFDYKYVSPRMFYTATFALGMLIGLSLERMLLGGGVLRTALRGFAVLLVGGLSASLFFRASEYRTPFSLWKAEIENNPSSPYGYHFYASHLMKEGKYSEALPVVRRAFELDPGAREVWNNLGVCYLNLGRPDEAEELFNRLARQPVRDCKPLYHLALVSRAKKQTSRALERVNAVLASCPNYIPAIQLKSELEGLLSHAK